jgi:anti-anti-sigma factor
MHTLVLLGELDRASAATLEAALEDVRETEVAQITLDLSKLTHIDATGVAVIAFRCRWFQRQGREVALIPAARTVQRAFDLAGMTEQLPFLERAPGDQPEVPEPRAPENALATDGARPTQGRRGQHEAAGTPSWRSIALAHGSSRRARARRARLAGGGL